MIIAFPPCTYLTVTGNKWFKPEYRDRFPTREQDRKDAIEFFMAFANADCEQLLRIQLELCLTCLENQTKLYSHISLDTLNESRHAYGLKDCHYYNLLKLLNLNYIYKDGRTDGKWHVETMKLPKSERSKARSKTFPGVAKAMAEQWAGKAVDGMTLNRKLHELRGKKPMYFIAFKSGLNPETLRSMECGGM